MCEERDSQHPHDAAADTAGAWQQWTAGEVSLGLTEVVPAALRRAHVHARAPRVRHCCVPGALPGGDPVGCHLRGAHGGALVARGVVVALEAVDKFVSFGLVHPDAPRCMEAINTLAWGVINCRFLSDGSASDEVVLLKMVGLLLDCLRCTAGQYLSDPCVWNMVRKCFQISRQPRATHLLRSSAEGMLQQMVLTIFGTQKERSQHVRVASAEPAAGEQGTNAQLQVYRPYGFRAMHFVLRFLAFLLAYGRAGPSEKEAKPRQRAGGPTLGLGGAGWGST
ncbi:unnamed protein product [Effrenium voratum]|nr:unnamed protein product [Effrenium voratum]